MPTEDGFAELVTAVCSLALFRDCADIRLRIRHLQRNSINPVFRIARIAAGLVRVYACLDGSRQYSSLHLNFMAELSVQFIAHSL